MGFSLPLELDEILDRAMVWLTMAGDRSKDGLPGQLVQNAVNQPDLPLNW
jgi:hypothetical protein